MTKLIPISGYTVLAGEGHFGHYSEFRKDADGVRRPEAGSRALAHDFVNLCEHNGADGAPWYEQMDRTRAAFRNDVPHAGKAPLMYKQYVISPDPRDEVSLDTLRRLSVEWAQRWFSDYEVAVVYHDDGESGVMHAHVVVNNTNLETGRRLGSYLTDDVVTRLNQSLQEMSRDLGLRAFDEEHESRNAEEMRAAGTVVTTERSRARQNARGRHGTSRRQRVTRTKAEREMLRQGRVPWKDELRDCIDLAMAVSAGTNEFMAALSAMGVEVSESADRGRRGRPDWIFHHPSERDGGARECRGQRLGALYSRERIERVLAMGYADLVQAANAAGEPRVPVDPEVRRNVIRGIRVIGTVGADSGVCARDVTEMLRFNREHGVRRYSDYRQLSGSEARAAERVARAIGAFDRGNRARTFEERSKFEAVAAFLDERDRRGHGGPAVEAARDVRDEDAPETVAEPSHEGSARTRHE